MYMYMYIKPTRYSASIELKAQTVSAGVLRQKSHLQEFNI